MQLMASVCIWAIVMVNLARLPEVVPVLASFHVGKIVVVLGLILALATRGREMTAFFRTTPMGKCVLLIFFLGIWSIPFSVWKSGAVETFSDVSKTMLSAVVLYALSIKGREQTLRMACLGAVLLLAVLMILDKGTGRQQVSSTYDANDIALLFVTYLPILVAEALAGIKLMRPALFGGAFLALVGTALTQSRGGIVALSAVAAHTLLLAGKKRWIFLPLIALGAVVIVATADDALWERFRDVQSESDYNFTEDTGRIAIWKEGLALMGRHPFTGVGIGQFAVGLGTLGSGHFNTAHNCFIQIGAELGVSGMVTFIVLLVSMMRVGRAGVRQQSLPKAERVRFIALCLSVTGFCAGGFFLSQAYGSILYMLITVSAVMHRELQEADALVHESPAGVFRQPVPKMEADRPLPKPTTETLLVNARASRKKRMKALEKGDRYVLGKIRQGEGG